MDIEFGELPPPSAGNQRAVYMEAAEKLRANPTQWARIVTLKDMTAAANVAHRIRNGKAAAFRPAGAFESASRGVNVWARYVGDGTGGS